MKQGDKVTIECTIDACRFGYKRKEYRVMIGDVLLWVSAEVIDGTADEK